MRVLILMELLIARMAFIHTTSFMKAYIVHYKKKEHIKVLGREFRNVMLLEILVELNLNQHYLD